MFEWGRGEMKLDSKDDLGWRIHQILADHGTQKMRDTLSILNFS